MDTDSNYFPFSEESIEKLIRPDSPEMRAEEYDNDKYNFLTSDMIRERGITPNIPSRWSKITWAQYGKKSQIYSM